jgi:hypothetical protein
VLDPDELVTVVPLEAVFFNVNTPEDLIEANRWATVIGSRRRYPATSS